MSCLVLACKQVHMLVLRTHTLACQVWIFMNVCMRIAACALSNLEELFIHSKAMVWGPTHTVNSALKGLRKYMAHTWHLTFAGGLFGAQSPWQPTYKCIHICTHSSHCTCDLMVAGSCKGSPTNTTLDDPYRSGMSTSSSQHWVASSITVQVKWSGLPRKLKEGGR